MSAGYCQRCGTADRSHCDSEGKWIECDPENDTAYAEQLFAAVRKAAAKDAEVFSDEFPGEVCNTEETDWDAEAFRTSWPEIVERFGEGAKSYRERAWEVYCEALTAETKRLAA